METTKADLEALSRIRLQEALALRGAGHPSGAYYLAGYAVECAITTCVAKQFRAGVLPDRALVQRVFTHDLPRLLELAEPPDELVRDMRADPALASAWARVKD